MLKSITIFLGHIFNICKIKVILNNDQLSAMANVKGWFKYLFVSLQQIYNEKRIEDENISYKI